MLWDGDEEDDEYNSANVFKQSSYLSATRNGREASASAPVSPATLHDDFSADDESPPVAHEIAEIIPYVAILLRLTLTGVVAVCARFLVNIDAMVRSSGVATTFIGLIELPVVGNAAEVSLPFVQANSSTSLPSKSQNKMCLAVGIDIGSSMIHILLTFLIISRCSSHAPTGVNYPSALTLHFSNFETTIRFIPILVVNVDAILALLVLVLHPGREN